MNKPYQIIYADPPWDYRGQIQHNGKLTTGSASMHYPTMSLDALCGMTPMIKSWADPEGALLYMWVTSPLLVDGLKLMEAWGFTYTTIAFVWDKVRPNPGYYTMSQVEVCLVGKMKKIPQPRGTRSARQFHSEKKTKHSRKPEHFACLIEEMHPTQRKIELFARPPHRAGWDVWGNEAEKQA